MESKNFYSQFDKVASILQTLAYDLTKDMDRARALYLETAYRADKQKFELKKYGSFKEWIIPMMKAIFLEINGKA